MTFFIGIGIILVAIYVLVRKGDAMEKAEKAEKAERDESDKELQL